MGLSCWPFCPQIYEIIGTNSKANHNNYQNYFEVEIDFSTNQSQKKIYKTSFFDTLTCVESSVI